MLPRGLACSRLYCVSPVCILRKKHSVRHGLDRGKACSLICSAPLPLSELFFQSRPLHEQPRPCLAVSSALLPTSTAYRQQYSTKIVELCGMEDLWRSRAPPQPLDLDALLKQAAAAGVCVASTQLCLASHGV